MSRKKTSIEPSTFRFTCIKTDNKNYHLDFTAKEEALQYVDELNDSKIEWYGLYELDPRKDYMQLVTHKRLIPHNDTIYVKARSDESVSIKQRRKTRSKKSN